MAKNDKKNSALQEVLDEAYKDLAKARELKEEGVKLENAALALISALRAKMGLAPVSEEKQTIVKVDTHTHKEEVPKSKDKAFFGMSMSEAIVKYLSAEKEIKRPSEIATALKNGGFLSNSPNLSTMVSTELNRMPEALKIGKGQWGLKEWRK